MSKIYPGLEKAAHDPQGPGLQARRHRGRAGEGGRRRPRARPGVRGRRDRHQQPRTQLLVHRAQDFARRGRGARVPDLQPGDQRHRRSSAAAASAAPSSTTCAICPARPRGSKRRSESAPDGRRRLFHERDVVPACDSFLRAVARPGCAAQVPAPARAAGGLRLRRRRAARLGAERAREARRCSSQPEGQLVEQLVGDPLEPRPRSRARRGPRTRRCCGI